MLKIFKYEFRSRSILYKVFGNYKQCSNKMNITENVNLCNICHNSHLKLKTTIDIIKRFSSGQDALRKLTSTPCEEPVIIQETEFYRGKRFTEHESMYHHNVLEKSSLYDNTLFKLDSYFTQKYRMSEEEFNTLIKTKDWDTESPHTVATAFVSFGVYSQDKLKVTIDDEQFNDLTSAFVSKCDKFTDEQLIDCMIAIPIWPRPDHVKSNNFLQIWKKLDDVCLKRLADYTSTVDKLLYLMDLWYHMRLIRLSYFVYKGINKISRKCDDLTRVQMVQIMFYMSCIRKIQSCISMREYEYHLQKYITHMTIEEIGICFLAFFKTKTSILNEKILVYAMQRVVEEIHTINEITLSAIAKALRFSYKQNLGFTANDLVDKITEHRLHSLNMYACIHVVNINSKVHYFNEHALTKLAERFCKDPSGARLKDMERVAFLLSLFNYIPPTTPEILDVILEQLDLPQHVKASTNYPLMYLSLVYFLTVLQRFPEKHIRHLLSEEFLNHNFENRFTRPVQIAQIDYNRVLEGPEGSEHLLSPTLREFICRKNSVYIPDLKYGKLNNFDQMLHEVINLTKQVLGGEEYVLVTYTLPHFPRADILFHLDNAGQPLPIPEEMRSKKFFEDVVRPVGDGWKCVMVGGRNMYTFSNPRLLGEPAAKLRQLKILGYTPIVIPAHYWMGEKNRADYLKLKYFGAPG